MLDKLNIVQQRFNEISDLIIQPDIITDQKRYIKLNKEYKEFGIIIEKLPFVNSTPNDNGLTSTIVISFLILNKLFKLPK